MGQFTFVAVGLCALGVLLLESPRHLRELRLWVLATGAYTASVLLRSSPSRPARPCFEAVAGGSRWRRR